MLPNTPLPKLPERCPALLKLSVGIKWSRCVSATMMNSGFAMSRVNVNNIVAVLFLKYYFHLVGDLVWDQFCINSSAQRIDFCWINVISGVVSCGQDGNVQFDNSYCSGVLCVEIDTQRVNPWIFVYEAASRSKNDSYYRELSGVPKYYKRWVCLTNWKLHLISWFGYGGSAHLIPFMFKVSYELIKAIQLT